MKQKNFVPNLPALVAILLLGLGLVGCNEDINQADVLRSENEQAFLRFADSTEYQRISLPGLYVDNFVYMKWHTKGTGTAKPKLTDKVRIHSKYYALKDWRGKEDQLVAFYSNYTKDWPEPQEVRLDIDGVRIALQNMVVGDEVSVAVPWYLGLGAEAHIKDGASIPPFTAFFYRIKLLSINE